MLVGLDSLERIKNNLAEFVSDDYHYEDYVYDIDNIENELKALKFIVKKANIRIFEAYGSYFLETSNNWSEISKAQYYLLKKVL